jgi:hypothetical protein
VTVGCGGRVYLENFGTLTFDYNEIAHNAASVNGLGFGGGFFAHNISTYGQINFNIFHQNDCTMTNPASLGCYGFINSSAYLNISRNTFTNGNPQSP